MTTWSPSMTVSLVLAVLLLPPGLFRLARDRKGEPSEQPQQPVRAQSGDAFLSWLAVIVGTAALLGFLEGLLTLLTGEV